jgi:hypothetical protein
MSELEGIINDARDSVCAIMRIIKIPKNKKHKEAQKFKLLFVGTACGIASNKYLLTANHLFNGGKLRDPNDLFYAFMVPGNGPKAYHFPIMNFILEDNVNDLAILELDKNISQDHQINSLPISFRRPSDGSKVLTIGFPSPIIASAKLGINGEYLGGGQFFLKSHVNEGIVSAQYDFNSSWIYEFNVGWHHGESGGPIISVDNLSVFSIMQRYRNINTPHGIDPGPHLGISLECLQQKLIELGAKIK